MVRQIGTTIGRDLRFEELTPDRWLAEASGYLPDEVADLLLGYWAEALASPEAGLPTVRQVTGRPARTFAQWAADHAADFRG